MKARKLKLGINIDNGWMYCAYRKRGKGPVALGVISLDNNIILVYYAFMQGVVGQKGPTAHNSWRYVPWYVFQLMYFSISEKFS